MNKMLILIVAIFVTNCISNRGHFDKFIKNYRGDGKVTKEHCFPIPFFGYEYINFELPKFNLTKNCEIKYNVGKLPKDSTILIGLLIPDSSYQDILLKGQLTFEIYKEDNIYFKINSELTNYVHNHGNIDYHEFYYVKVYYGANFPDTVCAINNDNEDTNWKIVLRYENSFIEKLNIDAYIHVNCGQCNSL
jgi:hypothetical protein